MSQAKELKIASLNVGRFLEQRTAKGLKQFIRGKDAPDVLLLQDAPLKSLAFLMEHYPHMVTGVMTNNLVSGKRAPVGIVTLSRHFMSATAVYTIHGDGVYKAAKGLDDFNERYLGHQSDRLMEASEDRVLVCATIKAYGESFRIGQTHGVWVRDGVTNDVQRAGMGKALEFAKLEAETHEGLVLAGDYNFARGGEIYANFAKEFADCIPPDVETTLDPDHPFSKRGGKVVCDYVWNCPCNTRHAPHHFYQVGEVALHTGISDHSMITAAISRVNTPV